MFQIVESMDNVKRIRPSFNQSDLKENVVSGMRVRNLTERRTRREARNEDQRNQSDADQSQQYELEQRQKERQELRKAQ